MPRYDVHFQPLDLQAQQARGKTYTFGYTSPLGVAGPQKLINRWVKCFLTLQGSDPHNKSYGTGFSNLIGGNISSYKDVVDAVYVSVDECNRQISAQDRLNQPTDDERLRVAAVEQMIEAPTGDGFDLYISITNVAGLTVTIQLPTV